MMSRRALLGSLLAATLAEARPTGLGTLVYVFLTGALDGLSAVLPYTEAEYYRLRPNIAPATPELVGQAGLDLDGQFAFHPAMTALLPLFHGGELAVLHAVGSPDVGRSHFDAQAFMNTGGLGRRLPTGWLARAAERIGNVDPLTGLVSLSAGIAPALAGAAGVAAFPSSARLEVTLRGRDRLRLLEALRVSFARASSGGAGEPAGGLAAKLSTQGAQALGHVELVSKLRERRRASDPGVAYPAGTLGGSLSTLATLLGTGRPVRVACIEMPGFDTHAAQGSSQGRLAARLTELSQALASFRADLGDRFQNVTVLVCTEFGRTAAENGARGTDHGHGSVMFLMGGRVAGGRVVTRWPGLAKDRLFQGRDLAVTTDYRDVFWEVAEEALGLTSSTALFPGHRRRALGLFRPAAVSAQGGSLPGRGP